jgi:hypothetical protein
MTNELDVGGSAVSKVGRRRNCASSLPFQIAAAILVAVAARPSQALAEDQATYAVAAPPPTDSSFEVQVTPYGWLPWIHTHVRPTNPALRSASSTLTPGKLISHLTWVPFMGAAEIRSGHFSAVFDFIHAPLKGEISTRDILFGGGSAGLTMNEGSGMFFYRPIATPDQYLDVGAGFRVWGFGGDVDLQPALLPPVNLTSGTVWADPLIGARYHIDFGNGFGASAYGDVGGFGAGAKIDWQLVGAVDYKPKGWPVLSGGFRSLNFTYQAPRARFSENLYGPYVAGTFRF